MRTTSRQFARRATALLTSALLVMPLFPASAFASEQEELAPQVEETIVDEESSENSTETTEVDAVVEVDENANESAVGESDDAEATVAEESATLTTASGDSNGTYYYFEKSDPDENWIAKVRVKNVTSGSVSYNTSTKTLKLTNATVGGDVEASIGITIVLAGTNVVKGRVDCNKSLTMKGSGSIRLSNEYYSSMGPHLTISGCTIYGTVRCGDLIMKSGTINVSNRDTGISCTNMTMTGGSVVLSNCDYGIYASASGNTGTASVTIKKGWVTITNPSHAGIRAYRGNFTVTGGIVSITGSYEDAIDVWETSTVENAMEARLR